jgi:hypothetical protein
MSYGRCQAPTYLQDNPVDADTTEVVCALWNSNVTLDLPIRVR